MVNLIEYNNILYDKYTAPKLTRLELIHEYKWELEQVIDAIEYYTSSDDHTDPKWVTLQREKMNRLLTRKKELQNLLSPWCPPVNVGHYNYKEIANGYQC